MRKAHKFQMSVVIPLHTQTCRYDWLEITTHILKFCVMKYENITLIRWILFNASLGEMKREMC